MTDPGAAGYVRVTLALRDSTGREPWRQRAACRDEDPDTFYPNAHGHVDQAYEPAKKICRRCPVRKPCLEWALDRQQMEGVWGGFSPAERERMLRVRAIRKAERETDSK